MHIAIRVDALDQMGSGHLMRCLTLADAARAEGAMVRFVSRFLPPHLSELVRAHGHELVVLPAPAVAPSGATYAEWLGVPVIEDARDTVAALADRGWDWIVADHYAFDAVWETAVRQAATRVMAIDDLADRSHDCDMLLDQNYYSDMAVRYRDRVPSRCTQLLGPRYTLLRAEFAAHRATSTPRIGPVRRVLVFFGGIDADNQTAIAVAALGRAALPGVEVDVVIGASHPDGDGIAAACARAGFHCHVQPATFSALMAAADLAVGAGGGGLWERCCLGVPALVWAVADNQRRQVADAARQGWVYAPDLSANGDRRAWLECHVRALVDNSAGRAAMSEAAMAAVDGGGAPRVVRELAGAGLEVRLATAADSADLFAWRNDPSVRQASRHSSPIDWTRHAQWLASVLAAPDRALLIGHQQGQPRGVVRFDIAADEAEVSIYLVPGRPSAGTGGRLLRVAEQWLAAHRPDVRRYRAHVLGDNVPSHRLFAGAGYDREATWYSKQVTLP